MNLKGDLCYYIEYKIKLNRYGKQDKQDPVLKIVSVHPRFEIVGSNPSKLHQNQNKVWQIPSSKHGSMITYL